MAELGYWHPNITNIVTLGNRITSGQGPGGYFCHQTFWKIIHCTNCIKLDELYLCNISGELSLIIFLKSDSPHTQVNSDAHAIQETNRFYTLAICFPPAF